MGGGWTTRTDFKLTISSPGEIDVRVKLRIPGFVSTQQIARLTAVAGGGGETTPNTRQLARRVYGELDASRNRVDRAVASGHFWNVEVEGLQRAEWEAARDDLGEEARSVWSSVNAAYVLCDAMNARANDHYHRGVKTYEEPVPEELKRLRIKIRRAQEALSEFYEGGAQ